MSLETVWPQMRALRSEEAADLGIEWKILYPFRARPLLVPIGHPAQARAAVALFVDNRPLRWLGYFLLAADRLLAGRVLPRARLNFPVGLLFGPASAAGTHCAVQCGSPGPLSKLTVLSPGQGDESGRVAKVALEASADPSVHREAYWLRTLGASPEAARFLPKLLAHGALPCGRAFVTMSVLPGGPASPRFSARHGEFLAILAGLGQRSAGWTARRAAEGLRRRIEAVGSLVDPVFRATADAILAEIEQRMGARTLPACLVHGDFAAWNVRINQRRIYVFDWEYAEAYGNPLKDFLHFHLIARATGRRGAGPAFMRALLRRAARHADALFGPHSGVAAAAGPLALHYLLDTLTFYVEASRYLDTGHVVIRAYLRLLDGRARWLPRQKPAEVPHA